MTTIRNSNPLWQALHRTPDAAVRGIEILLAVGQESALEAWLDRALALFQDATGASFTALVSAISGELEVVRSVGLRQSVPADLVGEALDREEARARERWLAVPLRTSAADNDALVTFLPAAGAAGTHNIAVAGDLAQVLAAGLSSIRHKGRQAARVVRLESLLEIAAHWNRAQETVALLNEIAAAATRLLAADRASIFLWDRATHTLVGRPALGVPRGELRVADDQGVVGHVVQTGERRRVGRLDQREISRQADRQLGYVTRSLVCAPLVGRNGQRFGAFEVINKLTGEFSQDDEEALVELAAHAATALENTQEREALARNNRRIVDQAAAGIELVGDSPPIAALRSTIGRIADTDLAILILGENGTGKEVVAHSIHYQSRRRNHPFVAVNCAAIAETLLESELFGHERGAFTDAHDVRQGKFELAAGGTLLLDEIGELSPAGQAKLLRVLEEKVVVRVGGSQPIATDVRVLAATNRNLADMVRERRFREDLYFRLNVVSIELPPLRERGDDVLMLAEHFLGDFCRRLGRQAPVFSTAAREGMLRHRWPGNVRELRNLMERLAYLLSGDRVEPHDLAFIAPASGGPIGQLPPDGTLAEATDAFQAEFIRQAIDRAAGNMSEAAKDMGLHRSNLYRKMRQLGMPTSG
ncbi:MAG: sigma-54-dependent Fis family transcriptional regulator [Pirellulales bacterium]|nr:sigma-54-dependent Fis family transcriptional regulator [Pirellulales bacterium]